MKLTECYIENFGKLSGFKMEFNEGLNTILEDNGFGKTTFAAFLQAMFYGLDQGRAKGIDRKIYEPWQGGRFGGSLTFSVNGKSYRMERFFGKKEKEDTFALYNAETGLESKDYTENIGCELFGIDKESYGKSAYIPQGKVEAELSKAGDITAKLSDLLETDNDMASFDDAMDRLKKLKNRFKRTGGLIPSSEMKKSGLEEELKRIESLAVTENELKSKIAEKKKARKELDEKIEKLHIASAMKEKAEHYKTLKTGAEESEKKIKELECTLKKLPSKEEIEELYSLTEEFKSKNAVKSAASLSGSENELLSSYDEALITEEEYEEFRKLINDYKTERSIVQSAELNIDEKNRLRELSVMFNDNFPDDKKVNDINYAARRAREELAENSAVKKSFIPYIISAVFFLTGIVLFFADLPVYGAIPFSAGLVYLVSYILTLGHKKKKAEANKNASREAIKEAEIFFASYGIRYENNEEEAAKELAKMLGEYTTLKQKESNAARFSENSALSALKEELDKKSIKYFNKAFSPETSDAELLALYRNSEKIRAVTEKKLHYEKVRKEAEDALQKLSEAAGIFGDFPAERAYEEIKTVVVKLTEEKKNYSLKSEQLKEFIKTNGIVNDADAEFNTSELDASKMAFSELTEEIETLERRLKGITSDTEKIPEIMSELSEAYEETEKLKKKAEIIEKAEASLQTAKDNLAAKYLGPLADKFNKYKELLSAPENAELDAELNVGVIEHGEKHSSEAYSTGIRDTIAVALRFALIDALFETEKPVVVLDDPFTNLDGNRIENAKKMLQALSSEYQILYLTCHESRG